MHGSSTSELFTISLHVDGKPCSGLLDTGATRTILTSDIAQPTRLSDRVLRAYNGGVVETLSMTDVVIASGDRSYQCSCFIVPKGSQRVLFGQDVISELELIAQAHIVNTAPVSISVKAGVDPVAQPARRPPFSVRDEIEKELKRLVDADVIEPVRQASPWVSPIVPVRKHNGSLRLCVDYRQLNKNIVRERHSLPTVEEITAQLEGATVFSVLDAESGFHQILLDDESRPLTTFAAHCGLYRFKRLPFGIASAPEVFQRVVSDILSSLPGVIVYIDDILVYGRNSAEHNSRLEAVQQRLSQANLKLNWDKCHVGQERVKYLGHWLTQEGVKPDSGKLQAIADMPAPKSLTDVQRFLGMITYMGKFIPQLSQITEPLRSLAKRTPFQVDPQLLDAFTSAKEAITSSLRCLAYFRPSPDVPTAISCDASPFGLGAILWQKSGQGQWLPVTCASRSLADAETRYSQLEREMLGVVFALNRFRQYVLGRHVEVHTDHKPLIPIVCKPFDEVPPRLQRWLVALMPFSYSLSHVPGKQLLCVDALSRAPIADTQGSAAETRSMEEFVSLIVEACPVSRDDIVQTTKDDSTFCSVSRRVLTNSWRNILPSEESYYRVRDQLTVIDGILMLDSLFIIPEALRRKVMVLSHEGHPGQDIFRETLRQRVWWPGLTKDATQFAEQCSTCWRKRNNPAQDLLPTEIEGVWEKLAVDIVTIDGHHLLSIIDYGSRFPELLDLSSTTTSGVIDKLMEVFARFSLPASLVSDNGPQFASLEMAAFLKQLNIRHIKSSPRYPRSNGMVERFHRLVRDRLAVLKPHLAFHRRLQQVLFDIRNSHHRMLGTTPNKALFDRSVRCRVPAHIPSRIVDADHQIRAKVAMATAHDARRGVRSLPTLLPGTRVSVRDGYTDERRMWTVVEQYGRQVSISDGRKILFRNRQHVREFESPFKPLVPQCTSPPGNPAAVRPENSASPMPIVSTPTTVASATAATSVTATTPVSAAAAVPADASVPDVMPDPVLEVRNSSLGSSTSIMPAETRRHSTRRVREPKRFIEEF